MKARLLKAIAAALMHAVFGLVCAVAWFACWPALVYWVATGSDAVRAWVGAFGKAEDQAANAAVLGGHHKETVSSHAGRWMELKYGNPYDRIPARDPGLRLPMWVLAVHTVTGLFEKDHVLKAVEAPFRGQPLLT